MLIIIIIDIFIILSKKYIVGAKILLNYSVNVDGFHDFFILRTFDEIIF